MNLGDCRYTVSGRIHVTRSMTITGGTVKDSGSALLISAANVTVSGMTLHGPGYVADNGHYAIEALGSSASHYLSGVTLTRNTISGWDGDGIHVGFVTDFTISKNVISNIYYAGIMAYSVKSGTISGNTISNVVGTGNAYGIALTRAYGGLTRSPRSRDVVISGNKIDGVPHWEGLDTHGGQALDFVDNVITDCLYGIMIGASNDASGGVSLYAPLDVTVKNNTLKSGVTNGTLGQGIYFGGANAGSGVLGASNELATGGVISGNTITGYGSQNNGDSSAIQLRDTSGLKVTGNTIVNPSPSGIEPYLNNYDFAISGNTIKGPWSSTLSYAYGIYVHVDYNTGTISNNTFSKGSKSARSVLTEDVVVSSMAHNHVTVN